MDATTVKRWLKRFVLWTEIALILVLVVVVGVGLGAVYQMNKMLPLGSALDSYRAPVGTKILSSDGVLLATLAIENREPANLEEIPDVMRKAIVAIEDKRFWQHQGIDLYGISRAVYQNVVGRDMSQGASTITQQLARLMFLNQRREIRRKVQEALLAVHIERNWPKTRILEAYLNQVYFGAGAYGVKSAARIYFEKDLKDISLGEAALLAGLVQQPSRMSPYSAHEEARTRAKQRRNTVLQFMAEQGFVSRKEADAARAAPVQVAKKRPRAVGYFKARHFVQFVVDHLRERLGYDEDTLSRVGLTVITTLDWRMQQAAEQAARDQIRRLRSRRISEGALVCLDPHTGAIRALVGGVNEPWEKYQFDCATMARRQPGSTFKAFVYATAFENGKTPYSSVSAGARAIQLGDGTWYRPQNHGRYRGWVNYRSAFAGSVNGAAVNVCAEVRPRRVVELAHRLGIKSKLLAYPSLALGTSATTVLEMASAYGVFAANGKLLPPTPIQTVKDQYDQPIEDFSSRPVDTGLKQSTLDSMEVLTRAVVTSGTGSAASVVPNAHGKTGTTENHADAWFVGYTPDLVTAVWAGNRDNSPMSHVFGGDVCVPIWSRFMLRAIELNPAKKSLSGQQAEAELKRQQEIPPPQTPERVRIRVCTATGLLPGPDCKTSRRRFRRGRGPSEVCPGGHNSPPVDAEPPPAPTTPAPPDPAVPDAPAKEPGADT